MYMSDFSRYVIKNHAQAKYQTETHNNYGYKKVKIVSKFNTVKIIRKHDFVEMN